MKSIASIFPNASQSTLERNPALLTRMNDKNALQVTGGSRKGRSMNKTEHEFSLILEAMKQKGEISDWKFESIKLRLGDGCWYVPDFFVRNGDYLKFIEVKGFLRDDARVKFLTAKEIHPWAKFEMWRKNRKSGWARIDNGCE